MRRIAYLEGQLRENASASGDDEHTGYILEIEVDISTLENVEELVNGEVAITGEVEFIDYPEKGRFLSLKQDSRKLFQSPLTLMVVRDWHYSSLPTPLLSILLAQPVRNSSVSRAIILAPNSLQGDQRVNYRGRWHPRREKMMLQGVIHYPTLLTFAVLAFSSQAYQPMHSAQRD